MRITLILLCLSFSFFKLNAQTEKLKISPSTYNEWRSIKEPRISEKGNIISYAVAPQVGDQNLIIKNKFIDKTLTIERGKNVIIAPTEKWLAFSLHNYYDSIHSLKLKKVAKKNWPTDPLTIYNTINDSLRQFKKVKSWKYGKEKGDWIAILRNKDYTKKEQLTKKKKWSLFKKKEQSKPKENGAVLTLYHPLTFESKNIPSVTDYIINKTGNYLYYSTSYSYKDSIDSTYIYRRNTSDGTTTLIKKGKGSFTQLTTSKLGEQFSFLYTEDTTKAKVYQLHYWDSNYIASKIIVDTLSTKFDKDKSVSEFHTPYFSDNGSFLFFKVGEKPVNKRKDTLTEDEKYSLDLWSWTDNRIQSQQLRSLEKDKKEASLFVYSLVDNDMKKLTNKWEREITNDKTNNKPFIIIRSQTPYLKEMTWDGWYYDYYIVDIKSGNKKLILKKHDASVSFSESGEKVAYYSKKDSAWLLKNNITQEVKKLTKDKIFHNQYHDTPGFPNSSGNVIWGKDESYLVIKGQYDYWSYSVNESNIQRLTFGRENKTVFNYWKTNDEYDNTIDLNESIYFKTYNERNKKEGFTILKNSKVESLFTHDKKITLVLKAKRNNMVLYREMSFIDYPELQVTDLNFKKFKTLTNINPQQKKYNWGTVELVSWNSYNSNDSLSGLLYKPENFDSSKKYPMIVYFYEKNSQNYHRYYTPRPTASIIYPSEYVSNNYLIFIPDIKYEIGKPAQSAYDCIVSGTDYLIKTYSYIDSTKLGLQGQSWGGYQTAQLITMTDKYKCAMAGAPVSNMFSAYGGIRRKSGLNRAFQYEKGQSRIGKTIWEAPESYIENSPIFHLPKITTPLLIMHNDGDGAVPWEQGLELFNGLRRLQKPVWLLNYNQDAHNLKKRANKLDLSIRMMQFFDYYLQEKPAPKWLKNGREALNKALENSN